MDREVAHVLVRRGDVLAAQPELLHDHRAPGCRSSSATSAAVIHRSGRYEAVASSPTRLIRRLRLENAADDSLELVGDAAR